MKYYHKNPRRITDKQFEHLGESLEELGDLSGIVHDLNSDEIIGGNQRGRVFNVNHCEIELTARYDEPDEQGTVALGYVVWKGKRYAYRQVRWTPEQCAQANIQANKVGGTWDFDVLANEFELDGLLEWGFQSYELGIPGEDFDPRDEWVGMPEFNQEDAFGAVHTIKVHFPSYEDMIKFSKAVGQTVSDETKYIWYPKQKRENLKAYKAVDASES